MANVNFGTFTTVTPRGGDFLVGYRNASETKTSIASITALNLSYQYTTDTLRSNSGRYEQAYNSVSLMSPSTGLWDSTYTTVSSFSGFWSVQPDLSDLAAASGNWQEAYYQSVPQVSILRAQMSAVSMVSGAWNSTYTNVNQNSATWSNNTGITTVATYSAYWNNAFNTSSVYQSNSASYVVNGGNAGAVIVGTTDTNSLTLRSNNIPVLTILSGGGVQEGFGSIASGNVSHAEGTNTLASGNNSHSQNFNTIASGFASHAEGGSTVASKQYSHAAGTYVNAAHDRSWAWKGSTDTNVLSTTRSDQFLVSAAGGVYMPGNVSIGTDDNTNALTVKGGISATSIAIDSFATSAGAQTNIYLTLTVGGSSLKIPLYRP
jgi:hypothetical protein